MSSSSLHPCGTQDANMAQAEPDVATSVMTAELRMPPDPFLCGGSAGWCPAKPCPWTPSVPRAAGVPFPGAVWHHHGLWLWQHHGLCVWHHHALWLWQWRAVVDKGGDCCRACRTRGVVGHCVWGCVLGYRGSPPSMDRDRQEGLGSLEWP